MSGGVRNLRAMFENKEATSPPDRGRSPAGSMGHSESGASPRPLSKVRTSFVTVERSGQLGLQLGLKRENSGDPTMAKRRTSFNLDDKENPQATAERKETIATELDLRKSSTVIQEVVPESDIETPSEESDKKLGSLSGNSDRKRETTKSGNGKMDTKKAASTTSALSTADPRASSKPAATAKSAGKPTSSEAASKLAPISIAKTTTGPKKSPNVVKSAAAPKTPVTPVRSHMKESPTKTAEKKPEKKVSRASLVPSQTSKPLSRPSTSAAHSSAPKTRIQPTPPQTGFHKPRPKSPTRPVKLPASLIAHTASSGSKTTSAAPPTSRQTLSRASGNSQPTNSLQAHHALSRSPSRVNSSDAHKSSSAQKSGSLSKRASRPSLGPPPSSLRKQTSTPSLPKQAAPADESFLARMMRPTTSSASKTADKLSTTPPKKIQSVKRPVTRDGTTQLHEPVKGSHVILTPKLAATAYATKAAAQPIQPENVVSKEAPDAIFKDPAPAAQVDIFEVADAHIEPTAVTTDTAEALESPKDAVKEREIAAAEAAKAEELNVVEEIVVASPAEETPKLEELASSIESTPVKAAEAEEPAQDTPTTIPESPLTEQNEVPTFINEPEASKDIAMETETSFSADAVETHAPEESAETGPEEDPEDAKARAEIARLNAEFMKASAVETAEVA